MSKSGVCAADGAGVTTGGSRLARHTRQAAFALETLRRCLQQNTLREKGQDEEGEHTWVWGIKEGD